MKIAENKLNNKLLSYLIKSLLLNVAGNYLIKIEKDHKKPPKIIENYFYKAIILSKQKKLKFKKISNNLKIVNKEYENKLIEFIKSDQEYQELFAELNFTYNLIKNKELQAKVINEMENIFINSKEKYEPIKKQKEKLFNFNSFFNLTKNNVTYLPQYI